MKLFVTAAFIVAAVIISVLLGKFIASTKDFTSRMAIIVGALALWTACVWLLLLYWRNAGAQ
jgi:hypothetical protein